MSRLDDLSEIIGRTVSAARPAVVHNHYEGIVIEFDDGTQIILIGGGYDGYGDYIRVADAEHSETR